MVPLVYFCFINHILLCLTPLKAEACLLGARMAASDESSLQCCGEERRFSWLQVHWARRGSPTLTANHHQILFTWWGEFQHEFWTEYNQAVTETISDFKKVQKTAFVQTPHMAVPQHTPKGLCQTVPELSLSWARQHCGPFSRGSWGDVSTHYFSPHWGPVWAITGVGQALLIGSLTPPVSWILPWGPCHKQQQWLWNMEAMGYYLFFYFSVFSKFLPRFTDYFCNWANTEDTLSSSK